MSNARLFDLLLTTDHILVQYVQYAVVTQMSATNSRVLTSDVPIFLSRIFCPTRSNKHHVLLGRKLREKMNVRLLSILAWTALVTAFGDRPYELAARATSTAAPSPIVVAASQDWFVIFGLQKISLLTNYRDGNDGPWSSFPM